MNKIMVLKGGSPAIHRLGNIGREHDDYIRIQKESNEFYIGCFEEGFGFIDVKFRKTDCRNLSKEEVDDLNTKWFSVNGTPWYKVSIDYNGDIVSQNK